MDAAAPPTTMPTLYSPDRPRFLAVSPVGRTYRSPRRLAVAVRAMVLTSVFAFGCGLAMDAETEADIGSATGADGLRPLLPVGAAAVWFTLLASAIAIFVLLAWWTRRVYGNVAALGHREIRYREWTAFASWFVPGWNLVRPKSILADVWRITDPDDDDPAHWYERGTSKEIDWWGVALAVVWIYLCTAPLLPFLTVMVVDQVTAREEAFADECLGVASPRRPARARGFHVLAVLACFTLGVWLGVASH